MVKATRYLNLLKFKRFFKRHIIKTIKHKMIRIEEHDRNSYKTTTSTYNKRKKKQIYKVSFLEWLKINYGVTKKIIIKYVEKNHHWHWNCYRKLVTINVQDTILGKSKLEKDNIIKKFKTILSKRYQKEFTFVELNNDPENRWHVDGDYNNVKEYTNRFIVCQSEQGNLGTQYAYCPILKQKKLSFCNKEWAIYDCCENITHRFCETLSKKYYIKELTLSNVPSYLFHKSPDYNKDSCNRTIWVFDY